MFSSPLQALFEALCRIQQLLRPCQLCRRGFSAAGQTGQLFFPLFPIQPENPRIGAPSALPLLHREVCVCHGRQLGQMGDAQHLLALADLGKLLGHLLGGPAADACVHLVKDQRADQLILRQHIFQGQHNPGQLATGGHLADGPQLLPHVGRHKKSYHIPTPRVQLFLLKADRETHPGHIQLPQLLQYSLLQVLGRLLSGLGQHTSGLYRLSALLIQLLFQPHSGVGCKGDLVQLLLPLLQVGEHILHCGTILLL